jgi:hypothetical protein
MLSLVGMSTTSLARSPPFGASIRIAWKRIIPQLAVGVLVSLAHPDRNLWVGRCVERAARDNLSQQRCTRRALVDGGKVARKQGHPSGFCRRRRHRMCGRMQEMFAMDGPGSRYLHAHCFDIGPRTGLADVVEPVTLRCRGTAWLGAASLEQIRHASWSRHRALNPQLFMKREGNCRHARVVWTIAMACDIFDR